MARSHHRIDAAGEAGERAALEGFLDDYRDTVVRKASGVSDEDARRRLVPSLTTIEETARHAGHLDILREQIDGMVGD